MNGRRSTSRRFCTRGTAPSDVSFDVVVPTGSLFLLGDHRSDSSDSRDHLGSPGGGMVPVGDVIGRADWIAWPAGHWTRLQRAAAYARADRGRRPWATAAGHVGLRPRRRQPAAHRHPGAPLAAPYDPLVPNAASSRRKVKRRRRRSAIKEIPLLVGVAVLIALVLKTFLVQAFVIPSGSMENTIQIGDRVLVDKFTPWFGSKPQRGDVVVFKDPWQLAGRGRTPRRRTTSSSSSRSRGPDGHRSAALRQRQGPHQAGRRGRRRHREVLRHPRARDRQRHAAQRAVHPGRNKPSDFPFEETVPKGRLWVMGDHRANSAIATTAPRNTAVPSPRVRSSAEPWSSPGPSGTGPSEGTGTRSRPDPAGRQPPSARRIGWRPRISID